jgi:hypothetical protein
LKFPARVAHGSLTWRASYCGVSVSAAKTDIAFEPAGILVWRVA